MDRQASTWDVVFKMQYVSLFAVVVAVMAFGSMSVWHPEYMASQVIESNPQPVFFLICLLQGLFASGIWAWSHFTYGIDADETGLLRRFGLICFHAVTLSSLFLIDGI